MWLTCLILLQGFDCWLLEMLATSIKQINLILSKSTSLFPKVLNLFCDSRGACEIVCQMGMGISWTNGCTELSVLKQGWVQRGAVQIWTILVCPSRSPLIFPFLLVHANSIGHLSLCICLGSFIVFCLHCPLFVHVMLSPPHTCLLFLLSSSPCPSLAHLTLSLLCSHCSFWSIPLPSPA